MSPTDSPAAAPGVASLLRAPVFVGEDYGALDIALFGVPFDLGTFNRTGARAGPAAIRAASRQVRPHNPHTGVSPFALCRVADVGDVEINPMNLEASIDETEAFSRRLFEAGVAPLAVGGDHTVPLPILRAIARDEPVGLVHFDAHSDTGDEYFGSRVNYATPFRRGVEEGLIEPERVVQIGLRNMLSGPDALDWAKSVGMTLIGMDVYEEMGRAAVIEKTREVCGGGPVYITFDMDALDASLTPGTGVPEPGGLTMRDAMVIIRGVGDLHLVGGDVCEISPGTDPAGMTAINAAYLTFDILCVVAASIAARR